MPEECARATRLSGWLARLLNPESTWFAGLQQVLGHEACVLVTLNQLMGSSPRESGSRMVVSKDAVTGSIGGGNLEYSAIRNAREMLADSCQSRQLCEAIGLGPALNQCCGGTVVLHFEVMPKGAPDWLKALCSAYGRGVKQVLVTAVDAAEPLHHVLGQDPCHSKAADLPDPVRLEAMKLLAHPDMPFSGDANSLPVVETEEGRWWLERVSDTHKQLLLFGAGHVGQKVAQQLRDLPFHLAWLDQREHIFPADAPGHCTLITGDPVQAVATALPGSVYVVMTHSHELDEEICHAVLQRNDFSWLGLIGSDTKRRRFINRLQKRGIPEQRLQRLVCPVGLAGIRGKQPATIALSLVAQLMTESTWTDANN